MSQKIAPLSGFPEWLPGDRLVEQQVLDVVRETFELHGFVNIETRAVEPVERLLENIKTFGFRHFGYGADNIVGFKTRNFQNGNIISLHNIFN